MRMSSANAYEKSLQILYARQSELAGQQEKLTSGKNVNRPSDDPGGAARAERRRAADREDADGSDQLWHRGTTPLSAQLRQQRLVEHDNGVGLESDDVGRSELHVRAARSPRSSCRGTGAARR